MILRLPRLAFRRFKHSGVGEIAYNTLVRRAFIPQCSALRRRFVFGKVCLRFGQAVGAWQLGNQAVDLRKSGRSSPMTFALEAQAVCCQTLNLADRFFWSRRDVLLNRLLIHDSERLAGAAIELR